MNHPNTRHDPQLLVDIEYGVVLDAPPATTASRRWAESHPFVYLDEPGERLLAGPEAYPASLGATASDYVSYFVTAEVAGTLHLTRES